MVIDLVLLGLGIALQPVRVSAFIVILGTKDGTRNGLGFIAGWLACLVLVIAVVVLVTAGRPVRLHTPPAVVVQSAKLALGVALIVIAAVQARTRARPRILAIMLARLDKMSPRNAAVLAAALQPWTLVAAGALTVAQARLSGVAGWLALASFCLLATSSFAVLELYAVCAPDAVHTRLAALQAWLDAHANQVIIVVCGGLGLWLTAQGIYTLTTA